MTTKKKNDKEPVKNTESASPQAAVSVDPVLAGLISQMQALEPVLRTDPMEIPGRVRPGFVIRQGQAQEEMAALQKAYLERALKNLDVIVQDVGADAFTSSSTEVDVAVDARAVYEDAAAAVLPIIQKHGVFEPRHFHEMAISLRHAARQVDLQLNLRFVDGRVASTRQELISLGRELVRESVGDKLLTLNAVRQVEQALLKDKRADQKIRVLVACSDSSEVQSLREAFAARVNA